MPISTAWPLVALTFLLYAAASAAALAVALKRQKREATRQLREVQKMLGAVELRLARPRVEFHPSPGGDLVWITCFTLNRAAMLERTVRSLKRHEPTARLLVIDNGSTDGTPELLLGLQREGLVDKLLLNRKEDVPQWMKCFNLHQAFRLLAAEDVDLLGWIDDDMEVHAPWKALTLGLLRELPGQRVEAVALCRDAMQDKIHPPLQVLPFQGREVALKATVNGQFVVMPAAVVRELGLPPVREGINDYGVEDWYYSRLLQARDTRCAAADCAIHHGYQASIRVALDKESRRTQS